MSNKKIAICTTITNNYADYAVVCLQSFRHNSGLDIDLYVFVNKKTLSQNQINNFEKHKINIIDIDLSKRYEIPQDWPYPSECFWIFKCPEILYSLGYEYTLCVDTDTYCNRPFDINFLEDIQFVAGINRGKTNKEFLNAIKQLTSLIDLFGLSEDRLNLYSTNTGVLIFNNKYCYDTNFEEKIYQVFKKSMDNNIPRKGDDSLFCLYCSLCDGAEIKYIDNKFNDYKFYHTSEINEEPYIIHYGTLIKPWSTNISNLNQKTTRFIAMWLYFQKKIKDNKIC
jgi:lipopolysaccharide biosynthesis glycosyltransferase